MSPTKYVPRYASSWPGQIQTPSNRQLSEEIQRLYRLAGEQAELIQDLVRKVEELEESP